MAARRILSSHQMSCFLRTLMWTVSCLMFQNTRLDQLDYMNHLDHLDYMSHLDPLDYMELQPLYLMSRGHHHMNYHLSLRLTRLSRSTTPLWKNRRGNGIHLFLEADGRQRHQLLLLHHTSRPQRVQERQHIAERGIRACLRTPASTTPVS